MCVCKEGCHRVNRLEASDERLIRVCQKLKGDELSSFCYVHMQVNSVSNYAESLRLKTSVVFLFKGY